MQIRDLIRLLGKGVYFAMTPGMTKEHSFSRIGLYRGIQEATRGLTISGPVLSISHSRHLLAVMGVVDDDVVEANYPDVSILQLPFPDESFNLVISDQVFEHVDGLPSVAMRESMRVTRPGGWILHTTCFRTPYHGPGDYWRFTPEGLGQLARMCGGSEVVAQGAGSLFDPMFQLLGWTWLKVPQANWHPLNMLASLHRPSYASVVWVLARKPASNAGAPG